MSTAQKTPDGNMVRVMVRSAKEFLKLQLPKSVALQHDLLYKGTVLRFMVEPDVDPRQFGILLAGIVAVGNDFGPFAKGPGAKVFYVSGSGDRDADQHRLKLVSQSLNEEQQEKLATSFSIYNSAAEGDEKIDLTTEEGREVLNKSIPADVEVVVFDDFPGFFPTETIHPKKRKEVDAWLRGLSMRGLAIVLFDVESRKHKMHGESRAKSTVYLTHDATAPAELGGGHLLHRGRVGDADSMPKCISFWYTEVGGCLTYGFSVPDNEDLDAPRLTKKLERQIKVELMLKNGISQKAIAEELKVHAATICRDCREIDENDAKAARAKDKGSHAHLKQQGIAP